MKTIKENTALMELIKKLRSDIENMTNNGKLTEDFHDATECAIFEAEQLLEHEREMIYDAYVGGMNNINNCGDIIDGQGHVKYYKDTHPSDWQKDDE